MSDEFKRNAAMAALAEVEPGMRLGLGTGSTARHFVALLGERVRDGLDVVGVPTSEETARQAEALGIRLDNLDRLDRLHLTVDGADEIGPGLSLIKGGGAALLREKIVAAASDRMVVIADSSKRVDALGRFPLPIEVNVFGIAATGRAIAGVMAGHGAEDMPRLRRGPDGQPLLTDGGHFIVDALFGRISRPEALSRDLLDIAGVVQHGLFLGLCSRAYIAGTDGVEVIDAVR